MLTCSGCGVARFCSEVLQHVVFKSRHGAPPGPGSIPGTRRQTPPFRSRPPPPSTLHQPSGRCASYPPTIFSACSAPYCLFCLSGACMQCMHVNSDSGTGAPFREGPVTARSPPPRLVLAERQPVGPNEIRGYVTPSKVTELESSPPLATSPGTPSTHPTLFFACCAPYCLLCSLGAFMQCLTWTPKSDPPALSLVGPA